MYKEAIHMKSASPKLNLNQMADVIIPATRILPSCWNGVEQKDVYVPKVDFQMVS
jgi:hypothetical protein